MQHTTPALPPCPARSLIWDECDLLASRTHDNMENGLAENESEAFKLALLDHDMVEFEFEEFLGEFSAILGEISTNGSFHVEGQNMGWRHLTGHLDLEARDARQFIAKAFPRTSEWTLRGSFDDGQKILTYTLSHHDAPTGELYTVRKAD